MYQLRVSLHIKLEGMDSVSQSKPLRWLSRKHNCQALERQALGHQQICHVFEIEVDFMVRHFLENVRSTLGIQMHYLRQEVLRSWNKSLQLSFSKSSFQLPGKYGKISMLQQTCSKIQFLLSRKRLYFIKS